MLELAERLGRTRAELLLGSPAHRPLSTAELLDWAALFGIRAKEAEKARRR